MIDDSEDVRPATRGECENGLRPCPWVGCRYHLLLELAPRILRLSQQEVPRSLSDDKFVELLLTLEHSCALDLVVDGGLVLEEVGDIYLVTRERIRQLQAKGIDRISRRVAGTKAGRELLEVLKDLASEEWLVPDRQVHSGLIGYARWRSG